MLITALGLDPQGGACCLKHRICCAVFGDRAMKPSTIWAPRILSVFRIVLGLVLLQYGLAKLLGWPPVELFENLNGLSPFGIAGIFELVAGTLLIIGLFTRPVAFHRSDDME